jgi:hypothetical protein
MSVFPDREGAYHMYAADKAGGWATDDALQKLLDSESPTPRRAAFRRVVVRLPGNDEIVVAETPSAEEAISLAQQMIDSIDAAAERNEWIELQDRFVRPSAVLSVDIDKAE